MVKVSIIMPVYNDENFINKSINSVINQSLKDIELICIDDGSTDNSLKLLEKYAEEYNFIKITSQENRGSGKARNVGLNIATGEYVAFLDSDDIYVDETALEKMYNYGIEKNANMVSSNIKVITKNKTLEVHPRYKENDFPFYSKKEPIDSKKYGIPWYFYKNIFKRSFLKENNIIFPNYKRGQDPVFLVNILTKIDKFEALPIFLYGYNTFSGGGAGNKINTYEKRRDYINHFKETFDILKEAKYDEILRIYKKELFNYLKNFKDETNKDYYDIVEEVFGGINYFKNDFEEEYVIFTLLYLDIDSKEKLIKAQEKLGNLNLNNTEFIPNGLFIKYDSILNSTSYEEYKLKINTNSLERKNRKLEKENKKLIKKNKKIKKRQKQILNSKSWKMTKPLRKFGKIIK